MLLYVVDVLCQMVRKYSKSDRHHQKGCLKKTILETSYATKITLLVVKYICIKSTKILYRQPDIIKKKNKIKNSNFHLLPCLSDHSCKAADQIKQCRATILTNSPVACAFFGFRQVHALRCALCTLSFLLSSIRLFVFFLM